MPPASATTFELAAAVQLPLVPCRLKGGIPKAVRSVAGSGRSSSAGARLSAPPRASTRSPARSSLSGMPSFPLAPELAPEVGCLRRV
jgi:hypothetical protein